MGACLMYSHIIKKPAKKFIDRLPKSEQARIVAAIEKTGDIRTDKHHQRAGEGGDTQRMSEGIHYESRCKADDILQCQR